MTLSEILWKVARVIGFAWLGCFALLYVFQRQALYMPFGGEIDPARVGLQGVAASRMVHADGASTIIWSAPAVPGKPTLLYFHGNGGGLQHRAERFRLFRQEGWGISAMSYRGFSGASGSPSEAANVSDALAAYDALSAAGIAGRDIVLFGESLGTGIAIQVAAQRSVRAIVLDAPYSSVADVAASRFPMFPVRWVISDPYLSTMHIQRVTAPVLILTGGRDQVIPVEFGRKLAAAVPGLKRYVENPEGGHEDLLARGGFAEVKAWVEGPAR